jgi:putative transposase
MANARSVLSQLLQWIPRDEFQAGVDKYSGDKRARRLLCWSQFIALLFGQLTGHSSLRAITAGLKSARNKLYHLGVTIEICRSTLADANDHRNPRIFEAAYYQILPRVQKLAPGHKLKVKKGQILALDSTTIELCLSLSPWAQFHHDKGAVKLHTAIDLAGDLPTVVDFTNGRKADVRVARTMQFAAGTILVMDRGYVDYAWWQELTTAGIWFVTRMKINCDYKVRECRETNRTRGIMADQTIVLRGTKGREYEGKLRRVSYREPETGHWYVFVTNRFNLSAATICDLYRARWQVELFFKVLKGQLQVRKFAGTSVNAVQAQIWVALIAYLLMMAVKFQSKLGWGTPAIMAVLTVMLFSNRALTTIWEDVPKERCIKSKQIELPFFQT